MRIKEKLTHTIMGLLRKKHEVMVSDEEIESVWGNADFGPELSKREVVNQGVLKCAIGYGQGQTSRLILKEFELIESEYVLTDKGRAYLWAVYTENSNF